MTLARARRRTTYFADPDKHPQPTEPLPLAAFLAEHRHFVYRAAVVGDSVAEVVQRVGGWVFDQSAQGWHVTVITVDVSGAAALRICGAQSVSLAEAQTADGDYPQPHILMASTALCRANPSVHSAIGAIIRGRRTQVFLFGDDVTAGENEGMRRVEHPLSAATAAFKFHAACSVRPSPAVDSVEVFGHASQSGGPPRADGREYAFYSGRGRPRVMRSTSSPRR
jgi:hypothetical protein